MARRVLYETTYTFDPVNKIVTLPRLVTQERLVLITNITTGTVIYNFSDSALKATTYTVNSAAGTTSILLNYNTTAMSSTDKLQIMIDEPNELLQPAEVLMDPVGKFRVSTPQSLIDTDFEYGLQPTKWENIQLVNNRASFYVLPQNPNLTITNMTTTANSRLVTCNTATTTNIIAGYPVYVNGSAYGPADGFYQVNNVSAGVSFQYEMKREATATANVFIQNSTQVFVNGNTTFSITPGAFTGNNIPLTSLTATGNSIVVVTGTTHGLRLGNYVMLRGTAAATSGAPNGTWPVTGVINSTAFSILVTTTPTGALSGGTLHVRPEGAFYHRAFDGGVQYSLYAPSHGLMMARQTRRYFRYQSGKGIQFSTGSLIKPNFQIETVSTAVNVVTITTKYPHNLLPGITATISGILPSSSTHNGTYLVSEVLDPYTFKYTASGTPATITGYNNPMVAISNWYGASVRVGLFDIQNGFFYEYDGQTLYAVRRNSTYQLGGYVSALTNGASAVTGTNTSWTVQLQPGDHIVIRGMTYKVETITSDTAMTIVPEYRGSTITAGVSRAVISKTVDTRVPQSSWNIDKFDGTGPSGYALDLTKIQMCYLDYSWYGAGAIRFGFKDAKGEVAYGNRIVHNNQQTEAYMRSGNLPARYETSTNPYYTRLAATLAAGATTITVDDTTGFAANGMLLIANPAGSSYEYVSYTGKTATTFTGVGRGLAGGTLAVNVTANSGILTTASTATLQPGMFVSGAGITMGSFIVSLTPTTITLNQACVGPSATGATMTFYGMGAIGASTTHTYSIAAPIGIFQHSPQFCPVISHWGSSVIMDGRYDDDKSFVFSYGISSNVSITTGSRNVLMAIRPAPAIDNGLTGVLGSKEIINRMQLTLRSLDFQSEGRFLCELVMNGYPAVNSNFTQATNSPASLAQIATFAAGNTISLGETVYQFYTEGSGNGTFTNTFRDLSLVRDLGNSILGGGTTTNTVSTSVTAATQNQYPDGPDVVYLVVTNLEGVTRNIVARVSWTEAQA